MTVKYYNRAHQEFITQVEIDIFRTKEEKRAFFKRAKSRYNGWTAFLESRGKMGNVTYEEYNALPETEKNYWKHLAQEKNRAILAEIEVVKRKLRNYGCVGPLGSMDKYLMVDVDELSALLNTDGSPLAEMWKMPQNAIAHMNR